MKQALKLLIIGLCTNISLIAWDNLHFYRASFFFGEPRFERQGLSTLNARVGAGSTRTGRNGCSDKVCLLDIFGPQVAFKLGEGVPGKDFTKPQDLTLQLLEKEPARNCFGQFSFGGKFKTVELDLQFYQNITDGFFFELYVPIRKLEISDITCCDLSSDCPPCPNKNSPIWQTFLNQFDSILNDHCLCFEGVDHTGIGDTSAILGWAVNFEETEHLDFIDAMFQAGVLFPTGRKSNPNIIFDLPQGYDGHYGFPLNMSLAFGLYEWFTFGGHVFAMPFKSKCREIRMKTSTAQNGFIKLTKGCADVKRGALWQIGTYIKADHFCRNLSLLLGYSFSTERESSIRPTDTCIFDPGIVCSDSMLSGWKMHTIHLLGEFDFLQERCFFGPRLGFFGNFVIGGQRIFNTSIGGGMVGIDLVWSY
ncbi:MAG: hypothetical protein WD055_02915 [Candidatus Dependentiae bacterium]